jgi:hypothetical protein
MRDFFRGVGLALSETCVLQLHMANDQKSLVLDVAQSIDDQWCAVL